MIKLTIDDSTYEVEDYVFRRLINAAATTLRKCKRDDGKDFPASDQLALDTIYEIQDYHTNLI